MPSRQNFSIYFLKEKEIELKIQQEHQSNSSISHHN